MSKSKQVPPAAPTPAEHNDTIPRTGSGAGSALQAMLQKRQTRAGSEPQPTDSEVNQDNAR